MQREWSSLAIALFNGTALAIFAYLTIYNSPELRLTPVVGLILSLPITIPTLLSVWVLIKRERLSENVLAFVVSVCSAYFYFVGLDGGQFFITAKDRYILALFTPVLYSFVYLVAYVTAVIGFNILEEWRFYRKHKLTRPS